LRPAAPLLLIALLLAVGAFHAYRAEHPTTSYQSADERAYGALAISLTEGRYADRATGLRDPLHWPPAAPVLFAAGHEFFGDEASERTFDVPSAYWLQAIVSLGSALAAFALAWTLAGAWPGVVAAALVGFYPPLILATGEQLSEPLGALLLLLAFLALTHAVTHRSQLGYAAAGGFFGLAALARADLLFVGFVVALLGAAWHRGDVRKAARVAATIAAGTLSTLIPWVVYASTSAGEFVPVTRGVSSALFVGTYLPGDGTTLGMKRDLAAELYRRRPAIRGTPASHLDAREVLAGAVASRHPELAFDDAVGREARRNLERYALGDPLGFSAMTIKKVGRLWTRYARGGARHTSPAIRAWHIALVVGALGGLLAGLRRRRSLVLSAVLLTALYATAVHAVLVSHGRYNLPLMPALIAGGVAGWALWWRGAREEPD